MDFNALKKKKSSNLKEMAEKIESMNKGSSGGKKDERIYKPGFDKKEGIGNAVIRLIPAKEGDNFVRQFSHSFKGTGGFYWENSRSTIDEKDPVGLSNGLYWKKGEEEGDEKFQNVARNRKRNTKYYFNVYVEKDQYNKECEGQVMIMECGPQIFKVIEDAINPKFEDDDAIDPFDMWGGAPLKIRAEGKEIPDKRTGNKVIVPNYEKSLFGNVAEFLGGDEDKMKAVFEKSNDLSEFVKVKDFDELAKRFKQVTGEAYNALEGDSGEAAKDAEEDFKEQYNQQKDAGGDNPKEEKAQADEKEDEPEASDDRIDTSIDDDEDDLLSEFERLANGD